MNEPSLPPTPSPQDRGNWLDPYMPNTQVGEYQPRSRLIDMSTVRGILYRQRWLVAGVIALAAVAGLVLTLLATPLYEARSSVRIEPYGTRIVEGQNLEAMLPSNQIGELLATNMGVITSRALARMVAEDKNLAERPDFLGEGIDETRPPNISDEQWRERKLSLAAAKLHSSVTAELPQPNFIIEIAYKSEDPRIAAEMANAYSASFASMELRESMEGNEYAQEYLQEQIQVTRERLQEAEQAANQYARANGIIVQSMGSEDGEGGQTITTSSLASINDQYSAARANRIDAEQRWRSVQNLPPSQLAEVQNNSLLQGLIAQRATAQGELADLRQRYLDEHRLNAAKIEQIRNLDSQISGISNDIRSAIRSDYVVARNQEQALSAELAGMKGETLSEQDRQVDYSVLEREAQALRTQLNALLQRFNEISTATDVQSGTINQLDSAVVPSEPYSPSLLRNMAIALIMGMAAAGGLAVLRETLDDRVRSIEDVEERSGLSLLGHTPHLEESEMDVETSNRFGPLMEAYASIRSTIDFSIPRDRSVIQLTSSQAAEGKTTTAVILAELFAGVGRKTLLIDADVRRPSIARLLDIEKPKVGITEVMLGHSTLQNSVIKGYHENLDILPVAERPANATELFASRQLKEFIEICRNEYSLVIIDSSPVLGLADAPMLSRLVDGTIFVMEANTVSFSQIRNATRRIRASGGKPIGGILTKYRALAAGEAYHYQYSYYEYGDGPKPA